MKLLLDPAVVADLEYPVDVAVAWTERQTVENVEGPER